MTLAQAVEGNEYVVQRIDTDDEELDAFLFSLGCGITAFFYGFFDEKYYLCAAGAFLVLFSFCVCLPLAFKKRRREYGLTVGLKGRSLWLDVGDKKLTELLAGEITVKVPNLNK